MAGSKIIAVCGAAALAVVGMANLARAESTEADSGGFAIEGEEFPTPEMSPELTAKAPTKAVNHAVPEASDPRENAAGFDPTAPAAPANEGSR